MAPHCKTAAVPQPEAGDASVEWLHELMAAYESQILAAFEDVTRENAALRQHMAAMMLDAAAGGSSTALAIRPLQSRQFRWDDHEALISGPVAPSEPRSRDGDDAPELHDRPSDVMDVPETSYIESSCGSPTTHGEHAAMSTPGPGSRSSIGSMFSATSKASGVPLTLLEKMVRSLCFESMLSACIVANCITVGIWAHQLTTNQFSPHLMTVLESLEHFFVAVFLVELALKWRVFGRQAFVPVDSATRSNFSDMLLVLFTGLGFTWILPLCGLIFGFDSSAGPFKTLTVLRTIRLARLVRVFQRVPLFREAWLLIRGLSDSSRTLFWTIIVIFLVTYVFAIIGLSTIVVQLQAERDVRTDPRELAMLDELLELMGGLDRLMATLVQVLTMDSFHSFTRMVLDFVWWSWIYFYCYIAIAVVVLMNLVTAIIVENAMETSRADQQHVALEKESKRKKDMSTLKKLFRAMDTDGGGTLSWDEFSASFENSEINQYWKALGFQPEDCVELFHLLDDGDGEITTSEFLDALFHMTGPAQSKDIFKLQKTCVKLASALDSIAARVRILSMTQNAPSKSDSQQQVQSQSKDAAVPRHQSKESIHSPGRISNFSNSSLRMPLEPWSRQVSPIL